MRTCVSTCTFVISFLEGDIFYQIYMNTVHPDRTLKVTVKKEFPDLLPEMIKSSRGTRYQGRLLKQQIK